MHILIRRITLTAITALFCTAAFSSTLVSLAGDDTAQAIDNPWSALGGESMTQAPLLLAGGSGKVKGSKGSKVKIFYCQVKFKGSSNKFKAKNKKANSLDKANEKIDKCNSKAPKYQCFLGKCETNPSFS